MCQQKICISPFGNALWGPIMTTMIVCSVFYHVVKELKFINKYLRRYKTKTDLTTFCNIFQNIHCWAVGSSKHTSTSYNMCWVSWKFFYHVTFRPYNMCWVGQIGHIYPNRKSPFPHLEMHCKVQKWPQ